MKKTIIINRESIIFIMNTQERDKQKEYEKKIVEKFNKMEKVEFVLLKNEEELKHKEYKNVSAALKSTELFDIFWNNIGKKAIVVYVEQVDKKDLEESEGKNFKGISEYLMIMQDIEVLETDFIVVNNRFM